MLFDNIDFDFNMMKSSKKEINEDGYDYGNMFKDEYVPYKNYKVYTFKAKDEKNQLLLDIMETSFKVDDLNLYLDVHPDDVEVFDYFKRCTDKLEQLVKEYESKYQSLSVECTNNLGGWIAGPWPWEGNNV